MFVALEFGDVKAVAVGIIDAAVIDKGAVNINPNPISFKRLLANRQIIFALRRNFMAKKVSNFFSIVGVNTFLKVVLFAGVEFFGRAFQHISEFTRAPHGEIFPVGFDAH